MNKHMNWDHIRFFIEVARAGSVVNAAAALGVSHATVLRNISRLEQQLGIALFERLQTGYRITAQGGEILANAQAMQEQAELLVRRATARNPAPEGLLRVVVPERSLFDLMPLVAGFRAEFPLISVRTERGTPEALARSEVDLAFAITNKPPDELVGRQLSRIEFAYQASADYVESFGAEQPSATACNWIIWDSQTLDDEVDPQSQEVALRRFTRQPDIVLRAATHDDALSAIRAGIGVGLVRRPQPDLQVLPFRSPSRPVGVWMLTHQQLRRAGRIEAFMDYVVSRFANDHQASHGR
jgi:DNA-binding transcriptional LysR family regulator